MTREIYAYKKSKKETNTYFFTSVGPKGNIYKAVKMTKMKLPGLSDWYNLAFGDWDDEKMEMDDQTRSNNRLVAIEIYMYFCGYETISKRLKNRTSLAISNGL